MQCRYCNKELDFPEAVLEQLTSCPFCQQSLKDKGSNQFASFSSFFKKIVSEHGENIFSIDKEDDIFEVLDGYSNELPKETNMLRLLVYFCIPQTLYDALDDVDDEKPAVVKSVKRLCECLFIPSDTAFAIVKALAEAMGFNSIDRIKTVKLECKEEKKLFEALGVSENASLEQIKAAFKKLALETHPDKNPNNPKAAEMFRSVQEAYEILSNPQKRERLSESDKNSEFIGKMCKIEEDFPAYSDKLFLLFVLRYARKIFDSLKLSSREKAALLRDCVEELHASLGMSTFSLWEVFRLISDAFGVDGCLCEGGDNLIGPDGACYKTIKIGDDIWMAENYRQEGGQDVCAYEENQKYAIKYGRLYTWRDAMNMAPEGWHLPSSQEFENMLEFLKTRDVYALRSKDWLNSSNLTGFNDLPAGAFDMHPKGGFHSMGLCSYYWTSTKQDVSALCLKIDEESATTREYDILTNKFSVRYVKNKPGYVAPNVLEEKETDESKLLEKQTRKINPQKSGQKPMVASDGFDGEFFTDSRDKIRYKTVMVGNRIWMAENFKYDSPEAYIYEYDRKYLENYGRLYPFDIAEKLCPPGWHLPTREEFDELVNYVGSNYGTEKIVKKLKSSNDWFGGTGTFWGGDDVLGIDFRPGGARAIDGQFLGGPNENFKVAFFWCGTPAISKDNLAFVMSSDRDEFWFSSGNASAYCSVRYVRDAIVSGPAKKENELRNTQHKSNSSNKLDKKGGKKEEESTWLGCLGLIFWVAIIAFVYKACFG